MSNFDRWYAQSSVIEIDIDQKDELVSKPKTIAYRGEMPEGAKTSDDLGSGLQDLYSLFEQAGPDYQGSYYHFNIMFPLEKYFDIESLVPATEDNNGLFSFENYDVSLRDPDFFKDFKKFAKKEFIQYQKEINANVGSYLAGEDTKIVAPNVDFWEYESGTDLLDCIFGDTSSLEDDATDEFDGFEPTKGRFSVFFLTNKFYVPAKSKKSNLIHVQAVLMVGYDEYSALKLINETYPDKSAKPRKTKRKEPETTKKISELLTSAGVPSADKLSPQVLNTGLSDLKTLEQITALRTPTQEVKDLVHGAVKNKVNKYVDSGFYNSLLNAKNIETVEDVYDMVLDVIPLDDLMKLAVECCKKYIPEADMMSRTTDAVLKNLTNQEVGNILKYVSGKSDFISSQFKQGIVDKFEEETGDVLTQVSPQEFRNYLIEKTKESPELKDTISSVIFSSVPSALVMLASLDFSKAEELIEGIIESGLAQAEEFVTEQIDTVVDQALKKVADLTGVSVDQISQMIDLIQNFSSVLDKAYKEVMKFACETIEVVLDKIPSEQITEILDYASQNADLPTVKFKQQILDQFEQQTDISVDDADPEQIKNYISQTIKIDDDLKQATCSVIFAAIPAIGDLNIEGISIPTDLSINLTKKLLGAGKEKALFELQGSLGVTSETAQGMIDNLVSLDFDIFSAEALSTKTGLSVQDVNAVLNNGLNEMFSLDFDSLSGNIGSLLSQGSSYIPGFSPEIMNKTQDIIEKGKAIADKSEDLLKQDFAKFDDFDLDNLKNPMAKVFSSIGTSLDSYKNLSYTADISQKFSNMLVSLIDEIVVQTVSLMMREIAYMLEGTAKSDFANANGALDKIFDPNNIEELNTNENLKEDILEEVLSFPQTRETSAVANLPTEEEIRKVVPDFVDDMSQILTISEIGSLFSNPVENSIPYDISFDKVWYGLLKLEKYEKLAQKIDKKENLKKVFDIVSKDFNQVLCEEKIADLTKTKKILSNLCDDDSESNINKDYIDSIKDVLTKEAIEKALEQENDLIDDLLNNISKLNLAELGFEDTPLFCGPEAKKSGKDPLIGTTQHRSLSHLNKKEIESVCKSVLGRFESEINTFKSIISNPAYNLSEDASNPSSIASAFGSVINIGVMAQDVMTQLRKDPDRENPPAGLISELNNLVSKYSMVGQKIKASLVDMQSDGIDVSFSEDAEVLEISIDPESGLTDDYLRVFMNFGASRYSPEFYNVAPKTSKIFFRSSDLSQDAPAKTYETPLPENIPYGESGIFSTNFELQNTYTNMITNLVESRNFYGVVVEQVIKEHAEYISSQDLFKKSNFDRLNLKKDTVCDESSFFFYHDLINDYSMLAERIECEIGASHVPSPMEIVKIYCLFKAYIRVITTNEMLKSFFVFASYGMDSLMPLMDLEEDTSEENETFYFQYLKDQIRKRLAADQMLTQNGSLEKNIKMGYFAEVRKMQGAPTSVQEIKTNTVLSYLARQSVERSQKVFRRKLEEAGFSTKNIDTSDPNEPFGFMGIFQEEFSQVIKTVDDFAPMSSLGVNKQTLSNILAHKPNFLTPPQPLGGLLPDFGVLVNAGKVTYLDPPPVEDINFGSGYTQIPNGYYSNYPGLEGRLLNGGFFIEKGLDVVHAFKNENDEENYLSDILTRDLVMDIFDNLKDANVNDPDYKRLQQIMNPNGGATINDDIGRYLFGNVVKPAGGNAISSYSINDDFSNLNDVQIVDLLSTNGNISLNSDEYEIGYSNIENHWQDLLNIVFRLLKAGENEDGEITQFGGVEYNSKLTNQNRNKKSQEDSITTTGVSAGQFVRDQLLRNSKRYFKKFQHYTTLNILIPIDELESVDELEAIISPILNLDNEPVFANNAGLANDDLPQTAIPNITITEDTQDQVDRKKSVVKAALDRKYFLREGKNGKRYFKLPLVKIIEANEELPKHIPAYAPEGGLFPVDYSPQDGTSTVQIAESEEFAALIDSLDYKAILSFVSIMITELVTKKYPTIDHIFTNSKVPLKASIKYALRRANRFKDETADGVAISDPLYKKDDNILAEFVAPSQAFNINVIYDLLVAIIRCCANFQDPLWKTPWFFPGPATPIGVTAKILSGLPDFPDADASKKASDPSSPENDEKLKKSMGAETDENGNIVANDKCKQYVSDAESNQIASDFVSPEES